MRGWQRRRERQKRIALISECNSCTLECSELVSYLPSSSVIRRGKLTFGVLWTTWTSNNKIIWQFLFAFEAKSFNFYCSKISCKVATENLLNIYKILFRNNIFHNCGRYFSRPRFLKSQLLILKRKSKWLEARMLMLIKRFTLYSLFKIKCIFIPLFW